MAKGPLKNSSILSPYLQFANWDPGIIDCSDVPAKFGTAATVNTGINDIRRPIM